MAIAEDQIGKEKQYLLEEESHREGEGDGQKYIKQRFDSAEADGTVTGGGSVDFQQAEADESGVQRQRHRGG